jgi:NAD(P)H-hydrate epimerase
MQAGPMTRRQVRWVDRWAIETLGVPAGILMENAGRCAAGTAGEMVAHLPSPRVAILAGSGNNAGDGFVVARHLRIRQIPADVYLLGDRAKFSGEALANLHLCEKLLRPVHDVRGRAAAELTELWRPYDLLVDALGGTGITGALRGDLAAAVEAANATGVPILAIDIPTGLDCDSGLAAGPVIRATRTITFVARKAGFDAPGAAEYTGQVTVADIGVPVQDVPLPGDAD